MFLSLKRTGYRLVHYNLIFSGKIIIFARLKVI